MMEASIREQTDRFTQKWQSIDRLYEEYAKASGLTYMSLCVLEIIYNTPDNCTQKHISDESHYTKQNVNIIIKSFLEQGYVKLQELPSDRRNKQVTLTEAGKTYAGNIISTLWEIEQEAITSLTGEQRELLIQFAGIYEECFRKRLAALLRDR